jgi:hypothetical protein
MVAYVLETLLPQGSKLKDTLQLLATRTSINRTVAGVHFPVDSIAGKILGHCLGEYFACVGSQTPSAALWSHRKFEVAAKDASIDFGPQTLLPKPGPLTPVATAISAPVVQWYWKQARAEW